MIYHWLYPLHTIDSLSFLNVLRYVPFRVLASTMTAIITSIRLKPRTLRLILIFMAVAPYWRVSAHEPGTGP